MTKRKPLILVSNDDGITSRGIRALVETMHQIGEVVVVAPNSPQSGMGHAITIGNTLRLDSSIAFETEGIEAYECSGTPADCVKLAKHHVLKNRRPDLVVSGINHGSNSSISVLYSGTMSAAIEAAIEGLPAIGFSLCDYSLTADFSHCLEYIKQIALQVLTSGLPSHVALNVNIPSQTEGPIKGVKICRQAQAKYTENFEKRTDPHGRPYFWMNGEFVDLDKGEDTDMWALNNGYISIVPCGFDMTAYHTFPYLNQWEISTK
ncbi:5'/3'-nucleotidase SurE [Cytophagaceae bacterium YF14B1]|uniref:5'-nucleotidase SurE n=1 Tax=Xanthocytophaga flava TaxID=3048013 RepID=A0AAE3QMT4_9BACT|nr:5'/3'-nucleotidase SurE [Xanthocytophaga flavus]MDJ1479619.1 5'/3'-nucleotidase SurE [Xanthocytophaga flavus]